MKTIKTMLLVSLLSMQGLAHAYVLPPQLSSAILNQVSFDVTGEQWVSTKTARVIIAVNAGVGEDKLNTAYTEMTQKLQKLIGNSQWHITGFERSTDKSGLEQLYVTAETRLPESELATLKSRLKAASKAGEAYTVASVDYIPSLIEREAAQTALRNQIYNQIKTEVTQLNAAYPNQKYSVHNIEFIENSPAPTPMLMGAMVRQAASATNAAMPVSNNLQLRAHVVLATEPVLAANK
jgi:hypothetical protein